jgi:hypothetical protein
MDPGSIPNTVTNNTKVVTIMTTSHLKTLVQPQPKRRIYLRQWVMSSVVFFCCVSLLSFYIVLGNPSEYFRDVRFQVLTAMSMKRIAFWEIAHCSLAEVDLRFGALIMTAVRTSETSVSLFPRCFRMYCESNLQT